MGSRQEGLAVAGITLLGVLLRLPGFVSRPLWMDEALELVVARSPDPWAAMAAQDLHPPMMVFVERGLSELSRAEAWLRLPSMLASVAMIPLAWRACRTWGRPDAARLAAAAAATAPPLVVYAGEARPYALGAGLLLAVLAAVPGERVLALLIPSVLAMATLYGAWPVVLVATTLFAIRQSGPGRWAPLLAAIGTAGVLAPLALAQRAAQGAGLTTGFFAPWFWTPSSLPGWALRALPAVPGWLWTGRADTIAWAAGGVAIVATAVWARRAAPGGLDVLAWAPVAAFFVLAGLGLHPFGPTRHLIVVLPGLLVWGSMRLAPGSSWAARVGLAVAAIAAILAPRPPEQALPALLPQLGEQVVIADASASWGLRWYREGPTPALPWVSGPGFDQALAAAAPSGPFWFVATPTRPDAEADLQRWATQTGRSLDRRVVVQGAWATEIGPVR